MVFIVLSLVLMVIDHQYKTTAPIRSLIDDYFVYPLRSIVNLPNEFGDWASDSVRPRAELEDEIKELKLQNTLLNARLQEFASLKAEHKRLQALVDSVEDSRNEVQKVVVAEIMTVDLDPYKRQLVLNKGSNDGVYIGQPVIAANGVMGKIIAVSQFSSTALLITDASHSLPVVVNRSGVRAIAVGSPQHNRLLLLNQPNNTDIMENDLLVTSGFGCLFPSGYHAGVVKEINIDPRLPFAEIIIEPSAQLDRNREVLLVWPKHHKDGSGCINPGDEQ